jgi:hypothetical protein
MPLIIEEWFKLSEKILQSGNKAARVDIDEIFAT